MRNNKKEQVSMSIKGIVGLVVGIVSFILLFGSYAVVSPGNRGVLQE